MPLLITLSGCANNKEVDQVPNFIFKVKPIHLPVVTCKGEPAVPPLLAAVPPRPKDTDALVWAEDTRVAGEDCRSGLLTDKKYQDDYNKDVDAFNSKADEEAKAPK